MILEGLGIGIVVGAFMGVFGAFVSKKLAIILAALGIIAGLAFGIIFS